MNFTLNPQDISNQESSLVKFQQRFCNFFLTRTRSVATSALSYLKGLLIVNAEKNMAEMERHQCLVGIINKLLCCKNYITSKIDQPPLQEF